ncbi:hypothetical protein HK105_208872 [Polyrhizophydium stewartii]|uniref:Uncharacterized protein n=1 Tax=Polyrhizophydium stewartii TaxID=2732419 RepID=A0ABR4MWM5_9FUNG
MFGDEWELESDETGPRGGQQHAAISGTAAASPGLGRVPTFGLQPASALPLPPEQPPLEPTHSLLSDIDPHPQHQQDQTRRFGSPEDIPSPLMRAPEPIVPDFRSPDAYATREYRAASPAGHDDIIRAFNELDLANESQAYTAWLANKHVESLLEHPDVLNELDSGTVDALIKRLERSSKCFDEWIARKERERSARDVERRAREARERAARQMELERAEQRKQIGRQRIAEWRQRKDLERLRAEMQEHVRREQRQAEIARQRQASQRAFEAWVQAHRDSTLYRPSRGSKHARPPWVDIVSPPSLAASVAPAPRRAGGSRRGGSARQPLLSPPNLFIDYARYQALAPEYLRKYGVQVASAGMGLTPDEAQALGDPAQALVDPDPNTAKPRQTTAARPPSQVQPRRTLGGGASRPASQRTARAAWQ